MAAEREKRIQREREAQEETKRLRDEFQARRDRVEPEDFIREHTTSSTQQAIREVCDDLRDFLVEKNAQYGDSAISPVRIFSKADPAEQLLIRLDDKLSRIARGDDRLESDEDVLDDLIGYLILYKVAKRADS